MDQDGVFSLDVIHSFKLPERHADTPLKHTRQMSPKRVNPGDTADQHAMLSTFVLDLLAGRQDCWWGRGWNAAPPAHCLVKRHLAPQLSCQLGSNMMYRLHGLASRQCTA
jgi:hypothetical protein